MTGSTGQSGFGFAPVMGEPRRARKLVRIARCGLFWMVDGGSGWVPFLSAVEELDAAKAAAATRFSASLVRVVAPSEVGR